MQRPQTSETDRAPHVEPPIRHVVPWRVTGVQPQPDLRLQVTFVDGTQGEVDLRTFLNDPKVKGTVFEALRDQGTFVQVQVVMGAAQWPNGADLAPDAMYDAITAHGRWTLA